MTARQHILQLLNDKLFSGHLSLGCSVLYLLFGLKALTHQPDDRPSAEKAVGLISLPELVKKVPRNTPKRCRLERTFRACARCNTSP